MSATARRSISLGCSGVANHEHAATAAELRASKIFLTRPPDASNESQFRGSTAAAERAAFGGGDSRKPSGKCKGRAWSEALP